MDTAGRERDTESKQLTRRRVSMSDLLRTFQCEALLPLLNDGTLEITNPGVDIREPWSSLSLNILPLRKRERGEVVTYIVEVKRDEDLASERLEELEPGEGPNQKFDVEVDYGSRGSDHVSGFDNITDLIDWIRSSINS